MRLGDADRQVLAYAAEHRFVLAIQVAELLGTSENSASTRLRRLGAAGLMTADRRLAGSAAHQITRTGIRAAGSPLQAPRAVDLGVYDHDLGLAWLWLAAGQGRFGPLRAVVSEREMRSADGRESDPRERFGVRLPGVGGRGGPRLHYPDMLLETRSGHRVAVELELTGKPPRRLAEIMGGYALDARVDAVLYLAETEGLRRAIEHAAARAGVSQMVHVHPVRFTAGSGAIGARRGVSRPAASREPPVTTRTGVSREPPVTTPRGVSREPPVTTPTSLRPTAPEHGRELAA